MAADDDSIPPVPRYGEYAPPEYSAPPQVAPPQYVPPQYVPPQYVPPQYVAPQYASPQQAPAPYGMPVAAGPRPRRTWDIVLTSILLVLGLFGALFGVLTSVGLQHAMASAFTQRGLEYDGDSSTAALVIVVSHVVLYLLAAGLSIARLVRARIAFWVPLVAGIVAGVVYWGAILTLVLGDPAFMNSVNR